MAPKKSKIVIAFDLYGTILSTESIKKDLATHLNISSQAAQAVAAKWRQYQLEYTWRIVAMGTYKPLDKITRAALRHAVAEHKGGADVPDGVADELMRCYDSLAVFPDVVSGLRALQERQQRAGAGEGPAVEAVVFSNGTEKMLSTSVENSPDLEPFVRSGGAGAGLFRKLISVDEVRTYKPTTQSYSHLQAEADEDNDAVLWLVSANPFDVAGARSAGLRSAWIDRAGTGWVDRLGEAIFGVGDDVRKRRARPTVIATSVDQAIGEILNIGL